MPHQTAFAATVLSKFPQDHFHYRTTGCGGEIYVHATSIQAMCTFGCVLLLLEWNREDSQWIQLITYYIQVEFLTC